jgi:formate dehydrogenase maturation protein FdhE
MPLIDLSRLNKYYTIRVSCTNCGHLQDLKVPKGERKEQFLKKGVCESCGCDNVLVLREEEIKREEAERKKQNEEEKPKKTKILWK